MFADRHQLYFMLFKLNLILLISIWENTILWNTLSTGAPTAHVSIIKAKSQKPQSRAMIFKQPSTEAYQFNRGDSGVVLGRKGGRDYWAANPIPCPFQWKQLPSTCFLC